jgi:hypothetical protein
MISKLFQTIQDSHPLFKIVNKDLDGMDIIAIKILSQF